MNVLKKLTAFRALAGALAGLTLGGWALILTLVVLLMLTGVIAYAGWTSVPNTFVPTSGYVALALGVGFSLVVGIGLMSLVFYSSRRGYDEAPKSLEPPKSLEDDTHPDV